MFSCCCKSKNKKDISQEEKLLNDMLLMDEEKDLIFQQQDEYDEFDLKLDLLDKKYKEEQEKLAQKRQIQEETSEQEKNEEKPGGKVIARRILKMADYVTNDKDTQNENAMMETLNKKEEENE